jgi:single-stranded-DNA-specific exonuclease
MGRDSRIRPHWKMVSRRTPASVADVIDIILQNRNLDLASICGKLKDLSGHLAMRGMAEGAALLAKHMIRGHKIVIVADYDCDGITSAAQIALFFRDAGYENFRVVIPSRDEGYGIPERAVTENPDAKIFLALDCGTLDFKPIRTARSMGAECIVIDHHEVPAFLPSSDPGQAVAPASVLINPKHPGCCSHFKEFCASGLSFLFLASLRQALRKEDTGFTLPQIGGKYLALAATGTITDLVPLVSANRILVQNGLRNLNANASAPLLHLAATSGLAGKTLTAGHIGFYLGPRINAAGRIAEGQTAYDLLISDHQPKLMELARELNDLNARRQLQEEKILRDIRVKLAEQPPAGRTLVMGSPEWPQGVVGIVASRVQQDLHYAPVVIFSIDERHGIARGSARSIPGFDIHHALSMCAGLLVKWGGHKAAAGLTIEVHRIKEFASRFEEISRQYEPEIFIPHGNVDLELPLTLIGPELFQALEDLEPHGMGNPAPVFALSGAKFKSSRTFGKDQNHVKLELENGLECVWWRGARRFSEIRSEIENRPCPGGEHVLDMVFNVGWNGFKNRLTLEIKDIGRFF